MELQLTEDERSLLQELLSSARRELRYEIADTDNSTYKEGLKARLAALDGILDRVGGLLES